MWLLKLFGLCIDSIANMMENELVWHFTTHTFSLHCVLIILHIYLLQYFYQLYSYQFIQIAAGRVAKLGERD